MGCRQEHVCSWVKPTEIVEALQLNSVHVFIYKQAESPLPTEAPAAACRLLSWITTEETRSTGMAEEGQLAIRKERAEGAAETG